MGLHLHVLGELPGPTDIDLGLLLLVNDVIMQNKRNLGFVAACVVDAKHHTLVFKPPDCTSAWGSGCCDL